jgi:N-formylglutamate deformylase
LIAIRCRRAPDTATTGRGPDFVLGDRYGTSCTAAVAETVETTLRDLGYSISRNKPYAGGFITEHYGNPAAGLHAMQLEINRGLYMEERRYTRSEGFGQLAADLEVLAVRLGEIPLEELRPYRAAAE